MRSTLAEYYGECNENKTKTMGWGLAANQRPELKLGKSVTQSAARIQMIIIRAKPVKPFPAPRIFMAENLPIL